MLISVKSIEYQKLSVFSCVQEVDRKKYSQCFVIKDNCDSKMRLGYLSAISVIMFSRSVLKRSWETPLFI